MKTSVLFICLGNICRSPMAEAIFRAKVANAGHSDAIRSDSAGTGDWHVGDPPHPGTRQVLRSHGIDAAGLTARTLTAADISDFDYLVVMDDSNLRDVERMAGRIHDGSAGNTKIVRLLDYADPMVTGGTRQVPDPYFSGGFDHVYRLIESGCTGLLASILAGES